MRRTPAQILLGVYLKELKLGPVEYEYRFVRERRWRADLAVPSARLLFECDGGAFRGGHRRGAALAADYERQNVAQMHGWRILRFTNQQVETGYAKAWLKSWLGK